VRSPPDDVPEEVLRDALHRRWDLPAAQLTYRPVGFGSHHWEVLDERSDRWFVSLDDLDDRAERADEPRELVHERLAAAFTAARAAQDAGAGFVVAPRPALDGALVHRIGDRHAVAVYPQLEGSTYDWGDELSGEARRDILGVIVELHALPQAVAGHAPVDDLRLPNRDVLTAAVAECRQRWQGGPYADRARELLTREAPAIERRLAAHDELAASAGRQADRQVLTHGEPHPGNVIETAEGWKLIDWDTVRVAPPERDLWMLAEADDTLIPAYEDAAGTTVVPELFDLYRIRWGLSEVAAYVRRFRRPHGDSADDAESWRNLVLSLEDR
jgi:hypothetical protein